MDTEQRLDLHSQLISTLIKLCGLQNMLLGLIAGQLQHMKAPAPPGVGQIAAGLANAMHELTALIGQELKHPPTETREDMAKRVLSWDP